MHLVLFPTDKRFAANLAELRRASIERRHGAPSRLGVIVDGVVKTADTAHVFPEGWLRYSDRMGEHRIELDHIDHVDVAYY